MTDQPAKAAQFPPRVVICDNEMRNYFEAVPGMDRFNKLPHAFPMPESQVEREDKEYLSLEEHEDTKHRMCYDSEAVQMALIKERDEALGRLEIAHYVSDVMKRTLINLKHGLELSLSNIPGGADAAANKIHLDRINQALALLEKGKP